MVEPYLNLKGNANEAIEFYRTVFEADEPSIMRVSDMPENPEYPIPEEMKDWISHAQMTICGTTVHFSDMQEDFGSGGMISLAVIFDRTEKLEKVYHKLVKGGKALMELEPQFFAKMYAWVEDSFGINWQLICG